MGGGTPFIKWRTTAGGLIKPSGMKNYLGGCILYPENKYKNRCLPYKKNKECRGGPGIWNRILPRVISYIRKHRNCSSQIMQSRMFWYQKSSRPGHGSGFHREVFSLLCPNEAWIYCVETIKTRIHLASDGTIQHALFSKMSCTNRIL
jgi:hypothetical protein